MHTRLFLKRRPQARPEWLHSLGHASLQKRVVKRKKHSEQYQRTKLAASIHNACVEVSSFVGAAELTAERVCQDVEYWLESKHEVTSADIQRQAATALRRYHPTAAYAYAPLKEYRLNRDEYGFIQL